MKTNIYSIFCIFCFIFLVACQSNTNKSADYVPSKKKVEGKYKAGNYPTSPVVDAKDIKYQDENGNRLAYKEGEKFTGISESKLSNGVKLSSETFVSGVKKGPYKIWYANGNLMKEGTLVGFKGDKEDGLYKEYYEGGELKYEYHYEKGRKVGTWKSWYENGQQWTQRIFKNNVLDGEVLVWDEGGVLTKRNVYQRGNLIDKQFDPNGLK